MEINEVYEALKSWLSCYRYLPNTDLIIFKDIKNNNVKIRLYSFVNIYMITAIKKDGWLLVSKCVARKNRPGANKPYSRTLTYGELSQATLNEIIADMFSLEIQDPVCSLEETLSNFE